MLRLFKRRRKVSPEKVAAQIATLKDLTRVPAPALSVAQREEIFDAADHPANAEVKMRAAVLLAQIYPKLAPDDPEFARRTHNILLRDLHEPRSMLAHPSCSWLVMTHLREENLPHIPWVSPEEVASAAECFYGFSTSGLSSEESHRRVRDLVKHAGLYFAREQRFEDAFRLLSMVPVPSTLMDADLFRLRNALILYELRRVRRLRRSLGVLMAAVVFFVLVCSPLLLTLFENPHRLAAGKHAWRAGEAIYWSIVTFTTLGDGAFELTTTGGRVLAMADSLLGMTFMGVVAGFVLSHVTPRALP